MKDVHKQKIYEGDKNILQRWIDVFNVSNKLKHTFRLSLVNLTPKADSIPQLFPSHINNIPRMATSRKKSSQKSI